MTWTNYRSPLQPKLCLNQARLQRRGQPSECSSIFNYSTLCIYDYLSALDPTSCLILPFNSPQSVKHPHLQESLLESNPWRLQHLSFQLTRFSQQYVSKLSRSHWQRSNCYFKSHGWISFPADPQLQAEGDTKGCTQLQAVAGRRTAQAWSEQQMLLRQRDREKGGKHAMGSWS